MEAVIISSGNFAALPAVMARIRRADLVIAADGGAAHLYRINASPDVVIGDMDSISPETRAFFESRNIPFICHPSQKDRTDTELCMAFALEKGADRITFLGVTGSRLDHTLANVFLLKPLNDRNIRASILDAKNEIHLVSRSLTLTGSPGDLVSVIPVTQTVTGLTLEGLAYPLENARMNMGEARGVSNTFLGGRACIRIKSGLVLVITARD